MRSEYMTSHEWGRKPVREVPSLVDLCVQTAIDNVRYLGNVGETDLHLLERFLPHCTVEQLMHVEDSTEDRDLSPVTDKLWKNFYQLQFGSSSTNLVVERMKQKKVSFKWRQLYEAKLKDMEEAQQKSFERIKQLYKKEDAKKQSRQVRLCTKVPPSSNKRSFYGGPGSSIVTKSGIMKKAKLEVLNSREVQNIAAMKRRPMHSNISQTVKSTPTMSKRPVQSSHSVSSVNKSSCLLGRASSSNSKLSTPMARRF